MIAFSIGGSAILKLLCRRPELTDAFIGIGLSRAGQPERVEAIVNGPWPPELIALEHEHGGADHWRRLRERMSATWANDLRISDDDLGRVGDPRAGLLRRFRIGWSRSRSRSRSRPRCPRGELLVLPAAGHFAIRDRPGVFAAAALDFLDRHLGAT